MSVLIIGEAEKQAIQRVIAHAEKNVVSLAQIAATVVDTKKMPPIGDDPNFVVHLPKDFRVAFSYEAQPRGTARHISISVEGSGHGKDCYPSPVAVNSILEEFGFKNRAPMPGEAIVVPEGFHIWLEENARAVNLLEFIDLVKEGDERNLSRHLN